VHTCLSCRHALLQGLSHRLGLICFACHNAELSDLQKRGEERL
jgi:hypothetical protein